MRRQLNWFTRLLCATLFAAVVTTFVEARPTYADDALVIRDFVLSRGIDEREPADTTYAFTLPDEQAYAFVRISNQGTPTSVTFVWHYEGAVHARVDVNVGTSPGWRTWSSANLKPGSWRVELISHSGLVLAERTFKVASWADESADVLAPEREERATSMRPSPTSFEATNSGFDG